MRGRGASPLIAGGGACADLWRGSWHPGVMSRGVLALLVLFSVELFCKVVAMGLVGSPHAFLRAGWHVVDAFLVASGWLEIVTEASNYTALRCLRALRALSLCWFTPQAYYTLYARTHTLHSLLHHVSRRAPQPEHASAHTGTHTALSLAAHTRNTSRPK